MSDPAVEAAAIVHPGPGRTNLIAVAAAREALSPLKEMHRPFTRDYPGGDGRTVCRHCLGPIDWPCATAGWVYSSEELS